MPVREGDVLAAVMTDKATVEIPSPADGRVSWIGCEVGQKAAVGSELMKLEVGDAGRHNARASRAELRTPHRPIAPASSRSARSCPGPQSSLLDHASDATARPPAPWRPRLQESATRQPSRSPRPISRPGRSLLRPCVRTRATTASICASCAGSGPAGRILREDVDAYSRARAGPGCPLPALSAEHRRRGDQDRRG